MSSRLSDLRQAKKITRQSTRLTFAHKSRRALSLMEVLLALAILAVSLGAISELILMGFRSAEAARDLTKVQILCDSKLSEIVAGVEMPGSATRTPFPSDPDYFYSTLVSPTDIPSVVAVTVLVETQIERARPVSFALTRWLPDPGVELPSETETDTETNANNSTSGGSTSGGQSGSGGGQ